VVAPIGFGVDDELTYNINADTSAAPEAMGPAPAVPDRRAGRARQDAKLKRPEMSIEQAAP